VNSMESDQDPDTTPLLAVDDLTVTYPGRHGASVRAVDAVSFTIDRHQTLGLVGESGSGKSTIGRAILGLAPVAGGRIVYDGRDITHLSTRQRRPLSRELQVIFQDPYGSLNPTRTIGQTLAESLRASGERREDVAMRVSDVLEEVGLPPEAARRYPTRFSGGQRQRIAIARAVIGRPRLIVCDEPVSALDLSVQAQVLNLLAGLQTRLGLSYLFISHDLAVVRHLCSDVMVLYRGSVVERGTAAEIYDSPKETYTRRLLDAAPIPDPVRQRSRSLTSPRW
jgi:ABC-type microcin C transport system duplicated ATPase subunit YejF